jgi:penicillin amidase
MYGDAKGNVGWWATGKITNTMKRVDTNFILDGPLKRWYYGIFDFSKNPSAVNPEWNYVYSANNQPRAMMVLYIPLLSPEDRAKRIIQLLEPKSEL